MKIFLTILLFLIFITKSYADFGGDFQDFGPSSAYQILTDINVFDNILGASNTTVQSALDQLDELVTSIAPSSPTDSCTPKRFAYDSSYFYVCIASNTWKRTQLATWTPTTEYILLQTGDFILLTDGTSKIIKH